MTGELAFALGDRSSRRLHGGSIVRLRVLQCRQGLFDPLGSECLSRPRIQRIEATIASYSDGGSRGLQRHRRCGGVLAAGVSMATWKVSLPAALRQRISSFATRSSAAGGDISAQLHRRMTSSGRLNWCAIARTVYQHRHQASPGSASHQTPSRWQSVGTCVMACPTEMSKSC
jgi:hypothetical protein